MTPVLSRDQMRAYDKIAIEDFGVPSLDLMETAGRGAAGVIAKLVSLPGAAVTIVCGSGNNGGDGFVVARHLFERGAQVTVVLVDPGERLSPDARVNRDAYLRMGGEICDLGSDLSPLDRALSGAAVVVDAVFGTGLTRTVEGRHSDVISRINRCKARRVALDVPSGLDADTGIALGIAVRADDTVTFGHRKIGLLTSDGPRHAGRLHVVDLGVPAAVLERAGRVAEVIETGDVASWIEPRDVCAHKHGAGSVRVIAGSPGKVGAALLVARGALRSGAGLVTVASWPEVASLLEARVLETMTARIDRDRIGASLDAALAGASIAVVGPGFGTDEFAKASVDHVVFGWDGVKVIDADALTLLAGRLDSIADAGGQSILTPHPGEAGRLLGTSGREVEKDRLGAAREIAKRSRAIVVLKGARTMVALADGTVSINTTGNPALATAGSGDVLAGMIAAFACTMPASRAACTAVHVHGLAADAWSRAAGGADRGLLASEIAERVPAVLAAMARGIDPLTV
jgi:ADP-dependent NAD(P)H-hydrate dehydratase / NAD(P)H-hydrate epimerase